ncbi:MAG TPA: aminotransferase class III-fold pyridoxal phosphate-dependent enzyme [Dehalococcoidia bacterium]|nr:aminotransferase class III-fold pyridoxal phosphate-dependent enzyme [Dehalococcoidia bacterium]
MTIIERYVELHPTSRRLAERAAAIFPDGVTHDMRFNSPFSLYIDRADGSRKFDLDGNEVVDFVMGHGALLLGHGYPAVVEAIRRQAPLGTHLGGSHEMEVRWGELVRQIVPSAEHVRFTSSGTEATMMALRLARAFTGREKVIRVREHFHGWNDSVTGQPPPESTTPASPGLPRGILEASIVLPENDAQVLERVLNEEGGDIAAMIFETTGAHWGTHPLDIGYIRKARELTSRHGVILIFDEVITGFRVAPGGAQEAYGITPDMTTMAKILGGGLPGGAVAGRAEIIDQIRFGAGQRIAHPGTFNANPLSAAAGVACLETVADGRAQSAADETAARLAQRLNAVFREESVAGAVYGVSSMLHTALGMEEQPPDGYSWGYRELPVAPPRVDGARAQALRLGMINGGVDLMAGGMMVSAAHTADDIDRTVEALRSTLRAMKAEGLVS